MQKERTQKVESDLNEIGIFIFLTLVIFFVAIGMPTLINTSPSIGYEGIDFTPVTSMYQEAYAYQDKINILTSYYFNPVLTPALLVMPTTLDNLPPPDPEMYFDLKYSQEVVVEEGFVMTDRPEMMLVKDHILLLQAGSFVPISWQEYYYFVEKPLLDKTIEENLFLPPAYADRIYVTPSAQIKIRNDISATGLVCQSNALPDGGISTTSGADVFHTSNSVNGVCGFTLYTFNPKIPSDLVASTVVGLTFGAKMSILDSNYDCGIARINGVPDFQSLGLGEMSASEVWKNATQKISWTSNFNSSICRSGVGIVGQDRQLPAISARVTNFIDAFTTNTHLDGSLVCDSVDETKCFYSIAFIDNNIPSNRQGSSKDASIIQEYFSVTINPVQNATDGHFQMKEHSFYPTGKMDDCGFTKVGSLFTIDSGSTDAEQGQCIVFKTFNKTADGTPDVSVFLNASGTGSSEMRVFVDVMDGDMNMGVRYGTEASGGVVTESLTDIIENKLRKDLGTGQNHRLGIIEVNLPFEGEILLKPEYSAGSQNEFTVFVGLKDNSTDGTITLDINNVTIGTNFYNFISPVVRFHETGTLTVSPIKAELDTGYVSTNATLVAGVLPDKVLINSFELDGDTQANLEIVTNISQDGLIGQMVTFSDQKITKIRVLKEGIDANSGSLTMKVYSNVTLGVTELQDAVLEATSDSIDVSIPDGLSDFSQPLQFNFTDAPSLTGTLAVAFEWDGFPIGGELFMDFLTNDRIPNSCFVVQGLGATDQFVDEPSVTTCEDMTMKVFVETSTNPSTLWNDLGEYRDFVNIIQGANLFSDQPFIFGERVNLTDSTIKTVTISEFNCDGSGAGTVGNLTAKVWDNPTVGSTTIPTIQATSDTWDVAINLGGDCVGKTPDITFNFTGAPELTGQYFIGFEVFDFDDGFTIVHTEPTATTVVHTPDSFSLGIVAMFWNQTAGWIEADPKPECLFGCILISDPNVKVADWEMAVEQDTTFAIGDPVVAPALPAPTNPITGGTVTPSTSLDIDWVHDGINTTGYRIYRTSTEVPDTKVIYDTLGTEEPTVHEKLNAVKVAVAHSGISVVADEIISELVILLKNDTGMPVTSDGLIRGAIFADATTSTTSNATLALSVFPNGSSIVQTVNLPSGLTPFTFEFRSDGLVNLTSGFPTDIGFGVFRNSSFTGDVSVGQCIDLMTSCVGVGSARNYDTSVGGGTWIEPDPAFDIAIRLTAINQSKLLSTAVPFINDTGSLDTNFTDTTTLLGSGHTYFYRVVPLNGDVEGDTIVILNGTEGYIINQTLSDIATAVDLAVIPSTIETWQMREHDIVVPSNDLEVNVFANSTDNSIVIEHVGTTGRFSTFKSFANTTLDGQTIAITWKSFLGNDDFPPDVAIFDGTYDRTSATDFPEDSAKLTKGAGLLTSCTGIPSTPISLSTFTCLISTTGSTTGNATVFIDYDTNIGINQLNIHVINVTGVGIWNFTKGNTIDYTATGSDSDKGTVSADFTVLLPSQTFDEIITDTATVSDQVSSSGIFDVTITDTVSAKDREDSIVNFMSLTYEDDRITTIMNGNFDQSSPETFDGYIGNFYNGSQTLPPNQPIKIKQVLGHFAYGSPTNASEVATTGTMTAVILQNVTLGGNQNDIITIAESDVFDLTVEHTYPIRTEPLQNAESVVFNFTGTDVTITDGTFIGFRLQNVLLDANQTVFSDVFQFEVWTFDEQRSGIPMPSGNGEGFCVVSNATDTFSLCPVNLIPDGVPLGLEVGILVEDTPTFTTTGGIEPDKLIVYHSFDSETLIDSAYPNTLFKNAGTLQELGDISVLNNQAVQTDITIVATTGLIGEGAYVGGTDNTSTDGDGMLEVGFSDVNRAGSWNFFTNNRTLTNTYSMNFWVNGTWSDVSDDFTNLIHNNNKGSRNGFHLSVGVAGDVFFTMFTADQDISGQQQTTATLTDDTFGMVSLIVEKSNATDTFQVCVDTVCQSFTKGIDFPNQNFINNKLMIGDFMDSNFEWESSVTNSEPALAFTIDELCIWENHKLTPAQLTTLFNSGSGTTCSNVSESSGGLNVTFTAGAQIPDQVTGLALSHDNINVEHDLTWDTVAGADNYTVQRISTERTILVFDNIGGDTNVQSSSSFNRPTGDSSSLGEGKIGTELILVSARFVSLPKAEVIGGLWFNVTIDGTDNDNREPDARSEVERAGFMQSGGARGSRDCSGGIGLTSLVEQDGYTQRSDGTWFDGACRAEHRFLGNQLINSTGENDELGGKWLNGSTSVKFIRDGVGTEFVFNPTGNSALGDWSSATGNLRMKVTELNQTFVNITTTSNEFFSDSTANNYNTYFYRIIANNIAGSGDPSDIVNGTLSVRPDRVPDLNGTDNGATVDLIWEEAPIKFSRVNSEDPVQGYIIQRALSNETTIYDGLAFDTEEFFWKSVDSIVTLDTDQASGTGGFPSFGSDESNGGQIINITQAVNITRMVVKVGVSDPVGFNTEPDLIGGIWHANGTVITSSIFPRVSLADDMGKWSTDDLDLEGFINWAFSPPVPLVSGEYIFGWSSLNPQTCNSASCGTGIADTGDFEVFFEFTNNGDADGYGVVGHQTGDPLTASSQPINNTKTTDYAMAIFKEPVWTTIGTNLGVSNTTFTDNSPPIDVTKAYRVLAFNDAGKSHPPTLIHNPQNVFLRQMQNTTDFFFTDVNGEIMGLNLGELVTFAVEPPATPTNVNATAIQRDVLIEWIQPVGGNATNFELKRDGVIIANEFNLGFGGVFFDDFSYPDNATADLVWTHNNCNITSPDGFCGVDSTANRVVVNQTSAGKDGITYDLLANEGFQLTDANGNGDFTLLFDLDYKGDSTVVGNYFVGIGNETGLELPDKDTDYLGIRTTISTGFLAETYSVYMSDNQDRSADGLDFSININQPVPSKIFFNMTFDSDSKTLFTTTHSDAERTIPTGTNPRINTQASETYNNLRYILLTPFGFGSTTVYDTWHIDNIQLFVNGTLATKFLDVNRPLNTLFDYTVKAIGTGGNSTFSANATVTTNDLPDPVTNEALARLIPTQIDLQWIVPVDYGIGSPSTGILPEEVVIFKENTTDTSGFFLLTTLPKATNFFNDTVIDAGKTYTYNIGSQNSIGLGTNVTLISIPIPDQVTGVFGNYTLDNTEIRLTWTEPSSANPILNYSIFRQGTGAFTFISNTTITNFTNNIDTLFPRIDTTIQNFNYTVSAISQDGAGENSTIFLVKFRPDKPTSLVPVRFSESQIDLSWVAPTGTIVGYKIDRASTFTNTESFENFTNFQDINKEFDSKGWISFQQSTTVDPVSDVKNITRIDDFFATDGTQGLNIFDDNQRLGGTATGGGTGAGFYEIDTENTAFSMKMKGIHAFGSGETSGTRFGSIWVLVEYNLNNGTDLDHVLLLATARDDITLSCPRDDPFPAYLFGYQECTTPAGGTQIKWTNGTELAVSETQADRFTSNGGQGTLALNQIDTVSRNVRTDFNSFFPSDDYDTDVESWDLIIGGTGITSQTGNPKVNHWGFQAIIDEVTFTGGNPVPIWQTLVNDTASASTTFSDTSAPPSSESVIYRVSAYANPSGLGLGSEEKGFIIPAVALPDQVTGLNITQNMNNNATLDWNDATGADNYQVFRGSEITWQLKEHNFHGSHQPSFSTFMDYGASVNNTFTVSSSGSLVLHSAGSLTNGHGYIYKSFQKSFLEGKDLTLEHQTYCTGVSSCSGQRASLNVADGSWEANKATVFPDDTNRVNLGKGNIGSVTTTIPVNPSSGIQNMTILASANNFTDTLSIVTLHIFQPDGQTGIDAQTELYRLIIGNSTTGQTIFNFSNPNTNYTSVRSPPNANDNQAGSVSFGEPITLIGSPTLSEFEDSTISPLTSVLNYTVRGNNTGGFGLNSTTVTFGLIQPIANLNATALNSTAILLEWDLAQTVHPSDPLTGVIIQRANATGFEIQEWELKEQDRFEGANCFSEPSYIVEYQSGVISSAGLFIINNSLAVAQGNADTAEDLLKLQHAHPDAVCPQGRADPSRGDFYLFKVFDKADLPTTGNITVIWGGYDNYFVCETAFPLACANGFSTRSLTLQVRDGVLDRFNSTDFPANPATPTGTGAGVPLKGAGILTSLTGGQFGRFTTGTFGAFIHANTTSYDLSSSTLDNVTLNIFIDDGQATESPTTLLQSIEIEDFGIWDFQRKSGTDKLGNGIINYTADLQQNGLDGMDDGSMIAQFTCTKTVGTCDFGAPVTLQGTGESNFTTIATVDELDTLFNDTGLDSNSLFLYRAKGESAVSTGAFDIIASATTPSVPDFNQTATDTATVNDDETFVIDKVIRNVEILTTPDALNNTGWTLDFEFDFSAKNNPAHDIMVVTDTDGSSSVNQDHIAMRFGSGALEEILLLKGDNTGIGLGGGASGSIPINATTTYFVTLERLNVTASKLSIFFDSARTIEIPNSPLIDTGLTSSIGNFTFISSQASTLGGAGRTLTGTIDNLFLDDGIITFNEDFSSNVNWTQINTGTSVTGGEIQGWGADATDRRVVHNLANEFGNATVSFFTGDLVQVNDNVNATLIPAPIFNQTEIDTVTVSDQTDVTTIFEQTEIDTVTVVDDTQLTPSKSNSDTATTSDQQIITSPPFPITTLVASTVGNTCELSWSAPFNGNSPIIKFQIFRSVSSGAFTLLLNQTFVNHTDLGLANNVLYEYNVTSINAFGDSEPSNIEDCMPIVSGVPNAPSLIDVNEEPNGDVTIDWIASTEGSPTGYKIERKVGGGGFLVLVANTGTSDVTFTDTTTTPATKFTYRISGINAFGTGVPSNEGSITTASPPVAPILSGAQNGDQIDLSWTVPLSDNPINGYKIDRRINLGTLTTLVANTTTTLTTFTDTNVTKPDTFGYRVRALSSAGEGTVSNIVDITFGSHLIVEVREQDGSFFKGGGIVKGVNSTFSLLVGLDVNSDAIFDNLAIGNYNFTFIDDDNFILNKTFNISAPAGNDTSTFTINALVFDVDCPVNGLGTDIRIKVNYTDDKDITEFPSTPVCDSTEQVSWSTRWEGSAVNDTSTMIADFISTIFRANAEQFLASADVIPTIFNSGENQIESDEYIVNMTDVTINFNLFLGRAPSGGGGGGGGSGGGDITPPSLSIPDPELVFADRLTGLSLLSRTHQFAQAGDVIEGSITVNWEGEDNLIVREIQAGDFMDIRFDELTPFPLDQRIEGIGEFAKSSAEIRYTIILPPNECNPEIGLTQNCFDPILHTIPIEMEFGLGDQIYEASTEVFVDGRPIPIDIVQLQVILLFIVLIASAVFGNFIRRRFQKGRGRQRVAKKKFQKKFDSS